MSNPNQNQKPTIKTLQAPKPVDEAFRGECKRCGAVLECMESELTKCGLLSRFVGEADSCAQVECPHCGKYLTVYRETPALTRSKSYG